MYTRPHRQFVDNLPGTALPDCLMLGTSNPPGVPRCVEFSMLLRGWNCISGFAGWYRLLQRQAMKSVGTTRVLCTQIKLVIFLRIRVKSYFREKVAWKKSCFLPSDELGFSKHCYFPLLPVALSFVCVCVCTDIPRPTLSDFFLLLSLLCCIVCHISDLFHVMHLFVLAAGVQSFGRHKDDRK